VPSSGNEEFAQETRLNFDEGDVKITTLKAAKDIAFQFESTFWLQSIISK
jgi:hypothetical protein